MDIYRKVISSFEEKGWALYGYDSLNETFREMFEKGRRKYSLKPNQRYFIFPLVKDDKNPYEIKKAIVNAYEPPTLKFIKFFNKEIYKVPFESLVINGELDLIVDKKLINFVEGAVDPVPHIRKPNIIVNFNEIDAILEHVSPYLTKSQRERQLYHDMSN